MKKLIFISILFMVLLVLPIVKPQELLIIDLNLADSNTASSTFVTVDSPQTFNINATTDAYFIVSFNGEVVNTGGVGGSTQAEWRLLLDGSEVLDKKSTLLDQLNPSTFLSITLLGFKEDISIGSHTIELQHLSSTESVTTRDISFIVNSNTLTNTSLTKTNSFDVPITNITNLTGLSSFTNVFESSLFNVSEVSDLILFANTNLSKINGNIEQLDYFYQVNDQQTPHFRFVVSNLGPERVAGNSFVFNDIPSGQHNISLFVQLIDLGGVPQTFIDGKILLTQGSNDNIQINLNTTTIENISNSSSGTFFNITSLELNVANNSDILSVVSGSFNRIGGGSRGQGAFRFLLENGSTSVLRESEIVTGNIPQNLFLTNVFEDFPQGITKVTLQQKNEVTGIEFTNITFTLIEVNDYSENIVIPPNRFQAAEDRTINDTPFLIKELNFIDSSTASATYVSIGTFGFNINISDTNANFFANLEAELTAVGPDGSGVADWRILIDGETVSEVTREFLDTSNGDIGSVVLFGQKQNLAVGSHTADLQHRVTNEQINSRDITFFVNQDTLSNNSRIKRDRFQFNISYSTSSFIEIGSGNFSTNIDQDILSFIDINISLPSGERQEFFYQLDGINTGQFKRLVNQLPENIHLSYSNLFNNVAAGSHTWRVFARNIPSTASTFTGQGNIAFVQTESDGLTLNSNSLLVEKQIDITDIFLEIARLELDVANQSDIAVLISGTFDTNTTPLTINRNTLIDFEIRTDAETSRRSINLLGSNGSDTGKRFYNFFFSDIFQNFNLGKNNISIFAKATPEKLNIINLTFTVFEVEDYDLSIQVPIFPIVSIISPGNNTRNNTHPINITFIASNDQATFLDCTLRNGSTIFDQGSFLNNVTGNLLLDTGLTDIDQTFDLEVICFDNGITFNLSSSAFLVNLTLDTVLPIIITIDPVGKFNKDIVDRISINALCNDDPIFRFNVTIFNSTNQIFSQVNNTPVGNELQISSSLDITDIGVGNYTVRHTCSDPHTKAAIPDYIMQKNTSANKLKWITPSGNEIEFKYSIPPKNPVQVLSYGSTKSNNDRYTFFYDLNATDDGTEYQWNFELENKRFPITYLPNSDFKGHFIMGDNWLDLEFNDPAATYNIFLNENNNYEIEITTQRTFLNFSSVGELNTAVVDTQFEIFFIKQVVDELSKVQCPTTTAGILTLWMIVALSVFFIWLAFRFTLGIVGILGSILLLVSSWFIAPCVAFFAFVLAFVALSLLVFFGLTGLGMFERNERSSSSFR